MADGTLKRRIQKLGMVPTGLMDYSTATISDAFQKLGIQGRVLDPAIRPLLPFKKIVGTAVTVKLSVADKPESFVELYAKAFDIGKKLFSPILVLECPQTRVTMGSGGAYVARNQYGFESFLLEGGIRDTDDLKRMDFQVFSRFISPEFVFGLHGVSANEPVVVGGVKITPGDIIVGDNDGVVAVAPEQLDKVFEASDEILAQERKILMDIDAGDPYLDVIRRHQPEAG
jgi:4-hydroxy-4-methyl-2-oxoglutarate aldolase